MRLWPATCPLVLVGALALLMVVLPATASGETEARACTVEGEKTADRQQVALGESVGISLTYGFRCTWRQGAIVFTRCPP